MVSAIIPPSIKINRLKPSARQNIPENARGQPDPANYSVSGVFLQFGRLFTTRIRFYGKIRLRDPAGYRKPDTACAYCFGKEAEYAEYTEGIPFPEKKTADSCPPDVEHTGIEPVTY